MQGVATLYGVRGTVDLRQRLARADVLGPTTMSAKGIEEVQVARGRWILVGTVLASDGDDTCVAVESVIGGRC